MRIAQTERDLVQLIRGRKGNSLLMALMAYQNPLILLFLELRIGQSKLYLAKIFCQTISGHMSDYISQLVHLKWP